MSPPRRGLGMLMSSRSTAASIFSSGWTCLICSFFFQLDMVDKWCECRGLRTRSGMKDVEDKFIKTWERIYQLSHQTHLALKPHSWPWHTGGCKKIKVRQMNMFLEYCFPLGFYGTPTFWARTCTHITLNNFLFCDLVVTLWRCLNSPTPCCKDSQELCEERTDGAEKQGALGRGGWRTFVLTGLKCPF